VSDKKVTEESVPGLPLVIGVTGHRDLRDSDREALERRVRSIFSDLKMAYPHTPLVLLSPLAEGADRLVAHVALDSGLWLIVPLPMTQALYEDDFQTAESKAEFRNLLSRAKTVLTLPPVSNYGEGEIRGRSEQYAQAGAYIARYSHILIALWDEVPSEKVGGTAQIVQFRLEGVPEPYGPRTTPLDLVAGGPLYHIITPRKSGSRTAGGPGELRKLYPRGYKDAATAQAEYDRIFSRTDQFNRDSRRFASLLASSRELSKEYIFSGDRSLLSTPLRQILDCYAEADSLATQFRRYTLRITIILFALVLAGVTFLQAYSDLEMGKWSLIIYMAVLGVAYLFYGLRKRQGNEFHIKYLDYRALAEGLRVQFFWKLAGLNEPVSDHYLRKQRTELDWIRKGIRVWTLSTEFLEETFDRSPVSESNLRLVLREWVMGQHRFFVTAFKRDQRALKSFKCLVRAAFLISLLLSAVQVWMDRWNPLIFSIGLALVIAGLVAGYSEKRALPEQIKQYSQMGTIFALAQQRLEELLDAGELTRALDIIEELGKEALRENGDWVILHRERPIEVPNP
jgi:hypothetical protein